MMSDIQDPSHDQGSDQAAHNESDIDPVTVAGTTTNSQVAAAANTDESVAVEADTLPEADESVAVEADTLPEAGAVEADTTTELSQEDAAVAVAAAVPDTSGDESLPVAATEQAEEGEDFAKMLDEPEAAISAQTTKVGDKVQGVLTKIGSEESFVDFGGRGEGVIKTLELQDKDGKVQLAVGDPLEAFVVADGDEVRLARSLKGEDRQADGLYQAFKAGMPVEGTVQAVNQWGLGVDIQGTRAFCPIAQIDAKYIENPQEYRDQTLQFRIIRFRDHGRNIVVSRRALMEESKKMLENAVRDDLKKGVKVQGKVTRLEPFGAFVDLGAGVEGMIHVSELRHERVEHPKEVLEENQDIEVVVLDVKSLGSKRKERISLSVKALEKDPWDEISDQFKAGNVVAGKVDSLESFGAFVELASNVRGMVHVSEMANKRIEHPRDVVSVGDEVKVVVLEVDRRRKRLRLSIKQVETIEDSKNMKEFQERQRQEQDSDPGGNSMLDALRRAQLIK